MAYGRGTGNGEKLIKNSKYLSLYFSVCQICQLCLDKANDDDVYHTNSSGFHETGTACMINIVLFGLIKTKLANLANTEVKREVLVVFINFPRYLWAGPFVK